MNARQLIHALTEDYVDMDTEVTMWAHDLGGELVRWTVEKVTCTTGLDGVGRIDLDLKEVAG